MAKPLFEFCTNSTLSEYTGDSRLAKALYFVKHSIVIPGIDGVKSTLLVCCSWPLEHPKRFSIGKPVEIWNEDIFETIPVNSLIPVSRITNVVIVSSDTLPVNSTQVGEHVLFVTLM